MRAIGLALALVATPAAAAEQQFDLVCSGQSKERPNARAQPAAPHYRIDLAAGSWCFESCQYVLKIQSLEPGKIILRRSDPAERRGYVSHDIDRISGKYSRVQYAGIGSFWEEEGQCEIAPFSGFPAAKF